MAERPCGDCGQPTATRCADCGLYVCDNFPEIGETMLSPCSVRDSTRGREVVLCFECWEGAQVVGIKDEADLERAAEFCESVVVHGKERLP